MEILKGILLESEEYYLDIRKKIEKKLSQLPQGSVKARGISGGRYFYLQKRLDKKVVHKYLGKNKPEDLIKKLKMRKALNSELKKVKEALKILQRTKGRQRG